jgi:Putative restriction endonuclease
MTMLRTTAQTCSTIASRNPAKVYRESAEHRWLSVDQYLEFEAQSVHRHEYIDGGASHYLHYPKFIVEVLSRCTESIDRREKFLSYKQIGTVEEYVLVSQEAAQITIYRRAANWVPQMHTEPDEIAGFQSIGLSLPLAQIYEGVP